MKLTIEQDSKYKDKISKLEDIIEEYEILWRVLNCLHKIDRGNYVKKGDLLLEFYHKGNLTENIIKEVDKAVLYSKEKVEMNFKVLDVFSNNMSVLKNGLSKEENEQLFVTTNVTEIIALVLKGLHTLGR